MTPTWKTTTTCMGLHWVFSPSGQTTLRTGLVLLRLSSTSDMLMRSRNNSTMSSVLCNGNCHHQLTDFQHVKKLSQMDSFGGRKPYMRLCKIMGLFLNGHKSSTLFVCSALMKDLPNGLRLYPWRTYRFSIYAYCGVPRTLTSDRGTQFTSAVWSILFNRLGIVHIAATPYHSQSTRRMGGWLTARWKILWGWDWRDMIDHWILSQRTTQVFLLRNWFWAAPLPFFVSFLTLFSPRQSPLCSSCN
jgi:hypothetical protein